MKAGELAETAALDAKRALPKQGKSKDLPIDRGAAMANDGGTPIYGVGKTHSRSWHRARTTTAMDGRTKVFEGRAALGYDHGYDTQKFYLGLALGPRYVEGFVEGCPERIGEYNPEDEALFRDLWEDEGQR
jgi:hypothetical protein